MKKTILKVVSFLCCICMLVGCLPMKTYATDGSVSESIIYCDDSSVTHTYDGTAEWSTTTNSKVVYPGSNRGSYNTQTPNYSAIYDLSTYVGTYDLYAYNVTTSTTQTDVKVSISQAGYNVATGSWDQKNTGDHTWVALGTYTLDENSYVSFTNTSDSRMRDVAIKLVLNNSGTPITPAITMNEGSEIIITSDKATRNSDGGWTVIEKIIVAGPTGKYAYTTSTAKDNVTYPLGNFEGKYTLFVYNRCNNVDNHQKEVSVAVTYADGSKSTSYDQTGNSDASWVELGTYTFDKDSAVTFTNSSNAHMRDTAIKLVPVAEEPNVVVTGVSINNGESVSVEAGKTVTLTATVTPDNATDKTVTWTSTDDTVATVDENGTVTAKAVGSATITATTTNGKSATCAVTVTAAQTEETVYSVNDDATLQAAIDTATEGDTIKLLADIEYNSQLAIGEGITLDLNGKKLTAPGAATIKGYVVDNSKDKKGLLKVPKDQFAFINETNNPQMPVYNNDTDGYVFVTITDQNYGSTISENSFKLIFRPSFGTDGTAKNELLKNGGGAAGISIGLRLYWTEGGVETSQVLVYGKDAYDVDMVATVYSSQNKAFYINATGTNNFTNLKVAPYIKSATGVVWNGTPIPINSTN